MTINLDQAAVDLDRLWRECVDEWNDGKVEGAKFKLSVAQVMAMEYAVVALSRIVIQLEKLNETRGGPAPETDRPGQP